MIRDLSTGYGGHFARLASVQARYFSNAQYCRALWKNRKMNGSRPYMQIEHDLCMFCGLFFF